MPGAEIAETLGLGGQGASDWLQVFLIDGAASLSYRLPILTSSHYRELHSLVGAMPEEAGYLSAS